MGTDRSKSSILVSCGKLILRYGDFGARMGSYQTIIKDWAERAGIAIDGSKPYDIRVQDERFYKRVVQQGSLGLGESYMDGWWSCNQLDELFCRILTAQLTNKVQLNLTEKVKVLRAKFFNMQTLVRSRHVAAVHYDLGNEFFERMLDRRMIYSCGYWKSATSLEEAQEHKLELICQKIKLSSGDRILDIGCGWGGFLKFAVERYNCQGVGLTISPHQASYARINCAGLPIDINLCDYRTLKKNRQEGEFNKVVSIGMLEHVGPANYSEFMAILDATMAKDGLCLLQTIGDNVSATRCDAWLDRYIFPNGVAPSIPQLTSAAEGRFAVEDWHNFGPDYYTTLMSWHTNFTNNWDLSAARNFTDPDRFFRMWGYYLQSFAAAFKVRNLQLWQIVLSKIGNCQAYQRQ